MAGAFRTALPRIERAKACGRKAAALQAPGSWTIRKRCSLVRAAHAGRALVTVGDIGPHRDAALSPRLRAFRAQEGHKAAQAP